MRDTSCQYCGADGLTYVEETPAAKVLKYELRIQSLEKTVKALQELLATSERLTFRQFQQIQKLERVIIDKVVG